MRDIFARAIATANIIRADRVDNANQKILEIPQTQIGRHVGFDTASGLPIAKLPDGGEIRYLPLNFGAPTAQISLITASNSGIARGDWRGYI